MYKFAITALAVFYSIAAQAQTRRAIVLGGGCDTIFTPFVIDHARGLAGKGWVVTPVLKSGSIEERKSVASAAGIDVSGVRSSNTKKSILDAMDEVIADKSLQKGGQFFMSILAHGMPADKTRGHSICLEGEAGTQEMFDFTDPEFTRRLDILKKRGVTMGFSTMSCYGGGLVDAIGKFGCVVSSQTCNSPSHIAGVAGALTHLLSLDASQARARSLSGTPALTIEDLFLDVLVNSSDYRFFKQRPAERATFPQSSGFEAGRVSGEAFMDLLLATGGYYASGELIPRDWCQSTSESSEKTLTRFLEDLRTIQTMEMSKLFQTLRNQEAPVLADLKTELRVDFSTAASLSRAHNELMHLEAAALKNPDYRHVTIEIPVAELDATSRSKIARAVADVLSGGSFSVSEKSFQIFLPPDEFIKMSEGNGLAKTAQDLDVALKKSNLAGLLRLDEEALRGILNQTRLQKSWPKIEKAGRDVLSIRDRKRNLELNSPFIKAVVQFQGDPMFRSLNFIRFIQYMDLRAQWQASAEPPAAFRECAEFKLN